MSVVIGIDVGGSTTKIVGFTDSRELIDPIFVKAADPMTSIYGAFGKFTAENSLDISDVRRVMVTGVGSSYIAKPIYGLDCVHVSEFECIGLGGLYLSGLSHAVVVSMGTGTSVVYASEGNEPRYLGGSGVGGGTLMGLSRKLLGVDNIESIVELASEGNLDHVDLRINDMTSKKILPNVSDELTAANFGKVSDLATKGDLALGLLNMVYESVGMLAYFACGRCGTSDIVLTGNMTTVPYAKDAFAKFNALFGTNCMIPKNAQFATVIGAALSDFKQKQGKDD